jgi:hypothetical protein
MDGVRLLQGMPIYYYILEGVYDGRDSQRDKEREMCM